jgi:hypothetical protein
MNTVKPLPTVFKGCVIKDYRNTGNNSHGKALNVSETQENNKKIKTIHFSFGLQKQ